MSDITVQDILNKYNTTLDLVKAHWASNVIKQAYANILLGAEVDELSNEDKAVMAIRYGIIL
jgi:hypothetical protein